MIVKTRNPLIILYVVACDSFMLNHLSKSVIMLNFLYTVL